MPSQRVVDEKSYPSSTCGSKISNGTTEVVVIAAPGSKKRLRITSIQLTSFGDTFHQVVFRNGISGATFYSVGITTSVAAPTFASRDIVFGNGQGAGGLLLAENSSLNAGLDAAGALIMIGASASVENVIS